MFENFLRFDLTSLLIILIFFLFLEYRPPWWYRSSSTCSKGIHLIPGPRTFPLIGTTWTFYLTRFGFNRLHEYYESMHKKYGPIMKEEYWNNIPIINIFEKSDIVKVLKTGGKYPLRPPVEAVAKYRRSRPDRYASIGLVNEQGESWQQLRHALTPTLSSPKTINGFLPEVNEIADDWCNLLKQSRNDDFRVEDLTDICDRLGLELICALVLGRRMGFLLGGGESAASKTLASAIRQHFLSTRDTYFGLPIWKLIPTPAYYNLTKSEEIIYNLVYDLIRSSDDSTKDSIVYQSIISADLDQREKIAAIIDFISAGIHTMKNTLIFLLYLVSKDTRIQTKIIEDSTYAKACLNESFRLLPVANVLARILDEDVELAGHKIAKGTPVVCHFGIACRDSKNFKNAEEFRPERWLNDEKNETGGSAALLLVPFGAGKRICPGKRFIEQILPLILEYTIRNFEVSVDKELEIQHEFLLAPKGGVSMAFKDRIS